MPATQNTEIFRRVIEEGFNRGNFDAWDECFAPEIQEHQYGLPSTLAEFKQAIAGLRRAKVRHHPRHHCPHRATTTNRH